VSSSCPAVPALPSSDALQNTPVSQPGKHHTSGLPMRPLERRRSLTTWTLPRAVPAPATTALASLAANLGRSQSARAAPAVPPRAAPAAPQDDLFWPVRPVSARRIPTQAARAAAKRRRGERPSAADHAPPPTGSTGSTPAPEQSHNSLSAGQIPSFARSG